MLGLGLVVFFTPQFGLLILFLCKPRCLAEADQPYVSVSLQAEGKWEKGVWDSFGTYKSAIAS